MGNLQAQEMVRLLQRKQALEWHLQCNHYPPVSLDFVPVAEEAIKKGNEEDWDFVITMPNGITKTVGEIVEGLHLESFLDYEEE